MTCFVPLGRIVTPALQINKKYAALPLDAVAGDAI